MTVCDDCEGFGCSGSSKEGAYDPAAVRMQRQYDVSNMMRRISSTAHSAIMRINDISGHPLPVQLNREFHTKT
jgi:hypothetical protein